MTEPRKYAYTEELLNLTDALGDALRDEKKSRRIEIDNLCDAVGVTLRELREEIGADIAKAAGAVEEGAASAVAMAEARLATLIKRRAEVLSVTRFWLERCSDEAA